MHYMASSPPSVTRHYQGGFLLLPVCHMSAVCQRVRVGQDEQQGTPLQDGGGGSGETGRRRRRGGCSHTQCHSVTNTQRGTALLVARHTAHSKQYT